MQYSIIWRKLPDVWCFFVVCSLSKARMHPRPAPQRSVASPQPSLRPFFPARRCHQQEWQRLIFSAPMNHRIIRILLLPSGIQPPTGTAPTYPCSVCSAAVTSHEVSVKCTLCQLGVHRRCSYLGRAAAYSAGWVCPSCTSIPPSHAIPSPDSPPSSPRSSTTYPCSRLFPAEEPAFNAPNANSGCSAPAPLLFAAKGRRLPFKLALPSLLSPLVPGPPSSLPPPSSSPPRSFHPQPLSLSFNSTATVYNTASQS